MISTRIRSVSPDKTDWLASKAEVSGSSPEWPILESEILALHLLHCAPLPSYPLQKYQPASFGLAGFLFACLIRGQGYNIITDDADEPPSSGPLTLRDTLPNNANETKLFSVTPSTLPEYAVEVRPC